MKTLLLLILLVVGSYSHFYQNRCPPGQIFVGGRCVGRPNRHFVPWCPRGWVLDAHGNCVKKPSGFVSDSFNQDRCPPGQIFVGGRCVGRPNFTMRSCGLGEIDIGGRCIPGTQFSRNFDEKPCPPGMIMGPAGVCILKPSGFDFDSFNQDRCPPGQIFVGGRCVGRPNRHFVPPCPIGWVLDAHGNCVKKPSGFVSDSFNQNPCRPGQVLVGGRCVGIPDRFFFGTCTTSLECPDNRKCVDGVCLAV